MTFDWYTGVSAFTGTSEGVGEDVSVGEGVSEGIGVWEGIGVKVADTVDMWVGGMVVAVKTAVFVATSKLVVGDLGGESAAQAAKQIAIKKMARIFIEHSFPPNCTAIELL